MKSLKTLFWESINGKPRYNVKFTDIECRRGNFFDCDTGAGKVGEIKKYGLAVYAAEMLREKNWVLTESDILVCGDGARKLGTLLVCIDVGENLRFLMNLMERYPKSIREGYAAGIVIEGLDLKKKGKVIGPRPGYWAVFSEILK